MSARAPGQVSESIVSVQLFKTRLLDVNSIPAVFCTQGAAGASFRADCGEGMACWLFHVPRKVS